MRTIIRNACMIQCPRISHCLERALCWHVIGPIAHIETNVFTALGYGTRRHAKCQDDVQAHDRFDGDPVQIDPNAFTAIGGGANKLAANVSYAQAWGMEAILTFSLVMVVFAATDNFHASEVIHLPVRISAYFVHGL